MYKFKTKDFLSLANLTKDDILSLFTLIKDVKKNKDKYRTSLAYKKLALLFQKPSTRTRVSFEVAIYELGGYSIYLSQNDIQLGHGETVADTSRVLGRYVDYIAIRLNSHQDLIDFAENTSASVINALTDDSHPCQALSDLFTIYEKRAAVENIVYIGDTNNVCVSLMEITSKLSIPMVVSSPKGYQPTSAMLSEFKNVTVVEDPKKAAKGASVIYTDTWVSMHQQSEKEKRIKVFSPYQVTNNLLSFAKSDVLFMHCLPAERGKEVLDEVIDSDKSIVFDQAENRLHTQKAVLLALPQK